LFPVALAFAFAVVIVAIVGAGVAHAEKRASKPPGACVVPGVPSPRDCYEPQLPIRSAFYYPWFSQAWHQQGLAYFSHYMPTLGAYSSSDPLVLRQHLS